MNECMHACMHAVAINTNSKAYDICLIDKENDNKGCLINNIDLDKMNKRTNSKNIDGINSKRDSKETDKRRDKREETPHRKQNETSNRREDGLKTKEVKIKSIEYMILRFKLQ